MATLDILIDGGSTLVAATGVSLIALARSISPPSFLDRTHRMLKRLASVWVAPDEPLPVSPLAGRDHQRRHGV